MLVENILEWEKEAELRGIEKGIEKGKIEGLKEGELRSSKNKVIRLLNKKLKDIPKEIEERLLKCTDINKLDLIIDNIFDISSLEQVVEYLNQ